ncbi:hypothetical protein HELRODRAFT_162917 [Helobdella robusta]|uniref:Uncharacterized protein n=1 Tax=Helobdella robusta TaxID=6412 RepID=T1ETC7_HELRO|nr:hypothetical protein HELRODRAFT_162917 [Helobdella robusta]ESN99375.1 hypothetical protein HELRODRAFT_162917 [Helobdella robusta]
MHVIKTICFLFNVAIEIASNQDCFRFWYGSKCQSFYARPFLRFPCCGQSVIQHRAFLSKYHREGHSEFFCNIPPLLHTSQGFLAPLDHLRPAGTVEFWNKFWENFLHPGTNPYDNHQLKVKGGDLFVFKPSHWNSKTRRLLPLSHHAVISGGPSLLLKSTQGSVDEVLFHAQD